MGAINIGGTVGYLILIPFLLEAVVAFAWFLRVGQKVFFGEVSEISAEAKKTPFKINFALIVLIILCLAAPLIGLPLTNLLE
jgi:hydrogenase-4 component D